MLTSDQKMRMLQVLLNDPPDAADLAALPTALSKPLNDLFQSFGKLQRQDKAAFHQQVHQVARQQLQLRRQQQVATDPSPTSVHPPKGVSNG
ncbi:MAG: hypothetical protein ACYC26_15505 [Phycisphaerales bacterium]